MRLGITLLQLQSQWYVEMPNNDTVKHFITLNVKLNFSHLSNQGIVETKLRSLYFPISDRCLCKFTVASGV